ncbi:unnamed protein product [Timema podura]|uniref:Uncharacterized protein n=1 Tax=Timema podura TaxID=61482 RepID=A0ABN7NXA1_TIMPD|nr:unnamed protein product [Timema podura]
MANAEESAGRSRSDRIPFTPTSFKELQYLFTNGLWNTHLISGRHLASMLGMTYLLPTLQGKYQSTFSKIRGCSEDSTIFLRSGTLYMWAIADKNELEAAQNFLEQAAQNNLDCAQAVLGLCRVATIHTDRTVLLALLFGSSAIVDIDQRNM